MLLLPIKKAVEIIHAIQNPSAENIAQVFTPPMMPNPVTVANQVARVVENPNVGNITNTIVAVTQNTPISDAIHVVNDVKDVISDPSKIPAKAIEVTTRSILKNTGSMQVIYDLVETHINIMRIQADRENRWNYLPNQLIEILQNHYPDLDLNRVRYAESINTRIENNATAFPDEIFFPCTINPMQPQFNNHNEPVWEDLKWLLHELTHLEQYNRVGGLRKFLDKYSTDIIIKSIEAGEFNPHDILEFENEAETKALNILDTVARDLTQISRNTVRI